MNHKAIFLKAKNNKKEIIIIDDPISSFDSIYKNKIAYMLLKSLENKKTIIYKLNNYLKAQNRKSILETIIHLLTTHSEVSIPKDLADTIMNSKVNDLYYNVGLFIEGLLQNKKNDKGE